MFTNELRAIMSARTDGGEPSRYCLGHASTSRRRRHHRHRNRRPCGSAVGGPQSRLAGGPASLPTDAPTTVRRMYARGGGVILQRR